jgi:hypothetical protein
LHRNMNPYLHLHMSYSFRYHHNLLEDLNLYLWGFYSSDQIETRTLEEVNEVLDYASQTKTSLTRIMLDNMVVPLSDGDVDVSMLKEAAKLINGRFETEVHCPVYFSVYYHAYLLSLFLFLMNVQDHVFETLHGNFSSYGSHGCVF